METIIAAFISGIATIVATWISSKDRNPKPAASRTKSRQLEETKEIVVSSGLKPNTAWWTTVMSLFALLVAGTGFFVHHDLPSLLGLFGIPVVVIVLALTKPTKPWTAAAFVFGVSTISFLTEFAVKFTRGESIRLSSGDRWLPFWILLFSAGYAALGAGVCWWKRKKQLHS
jgi:hypothetical protein